MQDLGRTEEQETDDWFRRALEDLTGSDHWSGSGLRPRIGKTISPIIFVGIDSNDKPVGVSAFDTNGQLKVTAADIFKTDPVTAGAATAAITLTERLSIVGLHADATMSAVAANRNLNVTIGMPVIVSGALLTLVSSSTILLTADQNGAFFFASHPYHFTNVHGTNAIVADENPLPMTFEAGSTFSIASDNDQVGDEMGIELWYKKGGS